MARPRARCSLEGYSLIAQTSVMDAVPSDAVQAQINMIEPPAMAIEDGAMRMRAVLPLRIDAAAKFLSTVYEPLNLTSLPIQAEDRYGAVGVVRCGKKAVRDITRNVAGKPAATAVASIGLPATALISPRRNAPRLLLVDKVGGTVASVPDAEGKRWQFLGPASLILVRWPEAARGRVRHPLSPYRFRPTT